MSDLTFVFRVEDYPDLPAEVRSCPPKVFEVVAGHQWALDPTWRRCGFVRFFVASPRENAIRHAARHGYALSRYVHNDDGAIMVGEKWVRVEPLTQAEGDRLFIEHFTRRRH